MRQLSAVDAQFLNFETDADVANIGGLAILERPLPLDRALARLRDRVAVVPQLRRRLVPVPLGLDHPYWAEDEEPDLGRHVHQVTLPPPGDDVRLGELVAELHGRRLDRDRPLWEMYVIDGLAGGRGAVYTKLHHAAVDGVTGAAVLTALMDPVPGVPPPGPREPDLPPDGWTMLLRGGLHLAAAPAHLARFVAGAMPHLDQIPVLSQLPGAGRVSRLLRGDHLPELPRAVAPRTPLSGPVSERRGYAFAELPLPEVKRVKNAFGVTVNDVVLTLVASTLRRWLLAHDGLPDEPLVAGVPFALPAQAGDGNQVTIMTSPLATHLAGPVDRLRDVSAGMRALKERFGPVPASWLRELSGALPAALNGLADRAAFALAGQAFPPVNVVVSNVPGPQFPLYVSGIRLLAHHPVSVVTGVSGALNITVFSYDGRLDVGFTACSDMVPDVWDLPGHLRESLDELTAAATDARL
ncbi:wax ester/triacylglycerol synthase family O-acyltransferase [Nonomuraea pusilla]|uniref:Diacylglycerol O-acyltransferase n=1 Tax=Nonomuraea pusilla TaxID=46177 RepID=A0A1H8H4P3_9ACTN|nr:wax ester/triacylglycerol synthase family O-acyltransferase [Nonomuraea pusilla]SEN51371.1 acyltransferase, WS/DGAT/MGAT [Nonomuraea pusilla]